MYMELEWSYLMFFYNIICPTHYGKLLKFVKICNCFWIGSTSTKIGHFTACLYSLFAQKYYAMKEKHFYSLYSPISISTNIHIQHFIVCRFFYGCQSLVFVCHFHSCGWLWLTYINGSVVHSHKINDIRIMTNILLNEISGGCEIT